MNDSICRFCESTDLDLTNECVGGYLSDKLSFVFQGFYNTYNLHFDGT